MSEAKKLFIGVLAIQGSFKEHEIALLKCSKHNFLANVQLKVSKVSEACHLAELDGLVIPGGETTSIRHIIDENMIRSLREWSKDDSHVLFGTCAGLILLSKNLQENQPTCGQLKKFGILDVTTSRNFFGRQLNSFEGCVTVKEKAVMKNNGENSIGDAKPDVCNGVFIRAPAVVSVDGPTVQTLATLQFQGQEVIVGVQDQNCIGLAFHPELTEDTRWHAYFLKLIMEKKFKK